MQPFFSFQITAIDPALLSPQVSRALEKRTELVSRRKYPKMWSLTDKLNRVEKAPPAVREARQKRRTLLGLLDWLFGAFLLIPGSVEPQELLVPLLFGAACFGVGVTVLWRNRRTLLGVLSLAAGVFLGAGALGSMSELGRLLPLGAVCAIIGVAALLTRKGPKQNPFDRAAHQLLESRALCPGADDVRIAFSQDGMVLGYGQKDSHTVPYSSFELVLETEDLLLPIYDDSVVILQKKDLLCGAVPELREWLREQVPYADLSQPRLMVPTASDCRAPAGPGR